jgi:hypothetical protein
MAIERPSAETSKAWRGSTNFASGTKGESPASRGIGMVSVTFAELASKSRISCPHRGAALRSPFFQASSR